MSQVHGRAVAARNDFAAPHELDRDLPEVVSRVARFSMRYGLVGVIGWIGAMKFTAYEAEGIAPFVSNSPLMGWAYGVMSHRQFSAVLGIVELAVAALIAVGSRWPRVAIAGTVAAVAMFLTTLSFMVTTPGVFESAAGGFPALSAMPGQFLVKDFALLGISVWLLGEALDASRRSDRAHSAGSRTASIRNRS